MVIFRCLRSTIRLALTAWNTRLCQARFPAAFFIAFVRRAQGRSDGLFASVVYRGEALCLSTFLDGNLTLKCSQLWLSDSCDSNADAYKSRTDPLNP